MKGRKNRKVGEWKGKEAWSSFGKTKLKNDKQEEI